MGTRLYVGNISFQASSDDLKDYFSKAGEVVSTKLITDAATGRSRGFGFVEMSSESEAQKAIEMFNGTDFLNRNIIVSEAKPQEQRGSRDHSGARGNRRPRERR